MLQYSENEVRISGNLGKDPDLRFTTNGTAVANFSVATNKRWKPKDSDEWQNKTTWHNVVAWQKDAEKIAEMCGKGNTIQIKGELQTREWDDKDGQKRYTTEVVVQTWRPIPPSEGGGGGNRAPHPADQEQGASQSQSYPSSPATTGPPKSQVAGQDSPPPDDKPF